MNMSAIVIDLQHPECDHFIKRSGRIKAQAISRMISHAESIEQRYLIAAGQLHQADAVIFLRCCRDEIRAAELASLAFCKCVEQGFTEIRFDFCGDESLRAIVIYALQQTESGAT